MIRSRITGIALVLSLLIVTVGCDRKKDNSRQVQFCLEFLYAYMTPEDDMLYTRDFWEENVSKTLEVRKRMKWDVPVREFLHFVLPLRAGDGHIDDFRTLYADTLCRRVEGLNMADAVTEINHWLHEQVEYNDEKPHANSPLETLRLGYGNCNTLSDVLVCALRAAGIPAREVGVTWAHLPGSHTWVEAWADGEWHYLDAGSLYPYLDLCWLSDHTPRIMLAKISVFGDYDGPETVLKKKTNTTLISNLKKYAAVKVLKIKVLDTTGNSVNDVTVNFLIGKNEKKTKYHTTHSDKNGIVSLETGYGDCAVTAESNGLWGTVKICAQDTSATVILQMNEEEAQSEIQKMELVPPPFAGHKYTLIDKYDSLRRERLANRQKTI